MLAPTLRRLLAPRVLLLHVLGVAATTAAVLLGLWQLDAWQAGRAAQTRDLAGQAPRPLPAVMSPDDPFPGQDVGRPVTVSGTWVPDSTLLVEGRELDGRRGLWVVTPVAVCAPATRDLALLAVIAPNVAGELVSFSKVIDAVPPLRAVDQAGRRP